MIRELLFATPLVGMFPDRKYWIIHYCEISNRLPTGVGDTSISKTIPFVLRHKNSERCIEMVTYTMRNKGPLHSQTQSTAATGKESQLLWLFPFKSQKSPSLIKTKDFYFLSTASEVLAIKSEMLLGSLRKGQFQWKRWWWCQGFSYVLATSLLDSCARHFWNQCISPGCLSEMQLCCLLVARQFQYWSGIMVLFHSVEETAAFWTLYPQSTYKVCSSHFSDPYLNKSLCL